MTPSRATAATLAPARRRDVVAGFAAAFSLILAGLIVYWPSLRVPYFGDDLRYMFQGWPLRLGYFFTHRDYDPHGFRPLQNIILAVIQDRVGLWVTWPIHVITVFLHVCLCGLVYAGARRLKLSTVQCSVAAVFAMLWQFSASAVIGISRFSQLESTLFGGASLFTLLWARQSLPGIRRNGLWAASVLCYSMATFSKETSGGFLLVVFLYLVWTEYGSSPRWLARTAILAAPYVLAEALYFALRMRTGAFQPSDVYSLGSNIVRNLGLIVVSAVTPVSSVITFTAVRQRDLLVLFVVMALDVLTAALVIAGVAKSVRKHLAGLLLILAIVSLAPVIPLRKVSELYMYAAMPFLAVVFGLALGALLEDRRWRTPVAVFLVFWVALNAHAVYTKSVMVDSNGRQAMAMLEVIRRVLPEVPQNGRILLKYAPAASDYSIFLVGGFGVLAVGTGFIGPLLGRADVEVKLVPAAAAHTAAPDASTFWFTCEGGQMRGPVHNADRAVN